MFLPLLCPKSYLYIAKGELGSDLLEQTKFISCQFFLSLTSSVNTASVRLLLLSAACHSSSLHPRLLSYQISSSLNNSCSLIALSPLLMLSTLPVSLHYLVQPEFGMNRNESICLASVDINGNHRAH